MLVDAVATRLQLIDGLPGCVEGALSLSEMLAKKTLPQRKLTAFVIPSGLTGRTAQSSQNAFLQDVDETVAVVLMLRTANDATGARAMPGLDALVWSVIYALAGWSPDAAGDPDASGADPVGVLELRRGRALSFSAGTAIYQLDFALQQQVRVVA